MHHQLNTFTFDGKAVRVIVIDGEPWFVAGDVAQALGYARPADAVRAHCKGVGETQTPSAGGPQTVKIIREADLYRLVLKSKLPTAQAFEAKVVEEILPSIRKTGSYSVAPVPAIPKTLSEALRLAADIEEQRATLACKVQQQAEDIAVLEPKATFADRVQKADGTHSVMEAGKILGTGQNRLFHWLVDHRFLFRDGISYSVYQEHLDNGLFVVEERAFQEQATGRDRIYSKVLVTGKGMVAIAKRMAAEGPTPLVRPQHQRPAAS